MTTYHECDQGLSISPDVNSSCVSVLSSISCNDDLYRGRDYRASGALVFIDWLSAPEPLCIVLLNLLLM